MNDVYMYVDECGNLDLSGKDGASRYFGMGSAVLTGDHGHALWAMKALRFKLAARGVELVDGFHAVNDSRATRHEVYAVISGLAPRFDFTLLDKTKLYKSVRARGEEYVYQLAWYLHFKEISRQVVQPDSTLHVAVATLGTAARRTALKRAVRDVCQQTGLKTVVASWQAASSSGLQIADYGLWAVQRLFERDDPGWYSPYVRPHTATLYDVYN